MGNVNDNYFEMRDRIFLLLKERNISQKDFAKAIHVSPQTITDWKKGKSHSFSGMSSVIASALHTTPSWLWFGMGEKDFTDEQKLDLEKQNELWIQKRMAELDDDLLDAKKDVINGFRTMMRRNGWTALDFADEKVKSLAEYLGVSTDYLLGVDTPPRKGVRIPVYRAVAAGIPIEAIEDIVDYEEIEPELAATGEFFGLRIKGQSMEPRICEGDVVIVRKQDDADTGDTAIVLVNGYEATCKKVKKDGHGIALIPNNPSYEVKYYSAEEISSLPVRIIGKVVELRGKF